MTSDRIELEQKFADFTDDELQTRWASGHLTAEAQTVAAAEAKARGLALEPYRSEEDAELPEESHDEEDYLGDWVRVAKYLTPTEAHVLCSFLLAHDIPVMPADTNVGQANTLWQQALGGSSVRVPRSLLLQAKALLLERRRGLFALDESFDPGDASAGPS